jgi:hypothetical protein
MTTLVRVVRIFVNGLFEPIDLRFAVMEGGGSENQSIT